MSSNLITIAKEWLSTHWQEATAGLLGILLVPSYISMEGWLLSHVEQLPIVWLLRTILATLVVAAGFLAYALSFRPSLKFLPALAFMTWGVATTRESRGPYGIQ
jgi:hypothetical protein